MDSTQQIPFSFQGSLQTKSDQFQVQPPNLLKAENARFTLLGQVNTRPGFSPLSTQLSTGASITQGAALQVFNNELLLFDSHYIYSYLPSNNKWINRGTAFSVVNQQYSVVRNTENQNNVDGTSLNGLECYVWEDDSGGLRYSVVDSSTQAFIVSDVQFYVAGFAPKVIAGNNQFIITFNLSGTVLGQVTINTNSPTIISTISSILIDGNIQTHYDTIFVNGTRYLAYNNNVNQLVILANNSVLHTIPFAGGSDGNNISCIAITVDSLGQIWTAYNIFNVSTNAVKVNGPHMTNLLISNESIGLIPVSNVSIIENPHAPGSILVLDEILVKQNPNDGHVGLWSCSSASAVVSLGFIYGVGLASKAFSYSGQAFVNTIYVSTLQSTYFTHCLTINPINAPVSKYNAQVAGTYRTNGLLSQTDLFNNTAGLFMVAGQRAGMFTVQNNITFTPLGLNSNKLNFNHANSFNAVINANNLIITGGIVQLYDGSSVVEDNFHLFPENIQATVVGNVFAINTGAYQYMVTFEWPDQVGNVHKSQPSDPILINGESINLTPGLAAELTLPTLQLTSKQNPRSPVQIVIYRTLANGSVFYKVASLSNDFTIPTLTYIDIMSDADIAGNQPGYWQEQVNNNSPPSCDIICNFGTRSCLSGLDDPNVVWFSQNRYDLSNYNSTPIEWSNLFIIGTDQYGNMGLDGITAIQKMDDMLIIFKQQAIFYLNGDGPSPQDTGTQFPVPALITSDTGCNNPNSIAFCPLGLIFKSDKGIYLLGRDRSVNYVGSAVEDFNNLTVTSAQLLNDTNEVIFTTKEGTVLCWNYYFNQPQGLWTTWVHLPAVDSVLWQNKLVFLQDNGVCTVQDPHASIYNDSGKPIIMTIQLPWIGSMMQGYQMVYSAMLLGKYRGAHQLQVVAEYNYNDGTVEQCNVSSSLISNRFGNSPKFGDAIFGGGAPTPYQFWIKFSRPKCQSIRLTLTVIPTNTGTSISPVYAEGCTLNSIIFNVNVLGGTGRITSGQSVGTAVTSSQ